MIEIQSFSDSEVSKAKSKLASELDRFQKGKVLIVGDLCLDEYLLGDVTRISPEAPVPVVDVQSQERRLGLAAFVAQNVRSLGGQCHLVGVVGEDSTSEEFRQLLSDANLSDENLIVDKGRPTTRKTRIMSGNHHVTRVDFEKRQFLREEVESQLIGRIQGLLSDVDVLVIEDYGKGVFSGEGTQKIIAEAQKMEKPVLVDPHRTTPISYYEGADLFKPNRDEAFLLSGLNIDDLREDSNSLSQVAQSLFDRVKCKDLVVTLGKEGMVHFNGTKGYGLPTQARQTFDVTGAGDTVLATLALAWSVGFSLEEACIAANCAAGVVVAKVGCIPCERKELLSYLQT